MKTASNCTTFVKAKLLLTTSNHRTKIKIQPKINLRRERKARSNGKTELEQTIVNLFHLCLPRTEALLLFVCVQTADCSSLIRRQVTSVCKSLIRVGVRVLIESDKPETNCYHALNSYEDDLEWVLFIGCYQIDARQITSFHAN